MAKQAGPSLSHKKDLILHTYDAFLVAQTRLLVQSSSHEASASAEINRRRELLLLDDLMGFAIAGRRIVELTHLKSFANRCMIPFAYLDNSEEPYQVMKLKEKIGFHTLMNRLIHASIIEHLDNMLDLILFIERPSKEVREKLMWDRVLKRNYVRKPIEQLLFVSGDDAAPVFFSMSDMIEQSIAVAEKVIEATARDKIFLELDYRGVD